MCVWRFCERACGRVRVCLGEAWWVREHRPVLLAAGVFPWGGRPASPKRLEAEKRIDR